MPLLPITLPPGMMRNGTPYQAKGRWYEGNLVRWHDGALRPIGGWQMLDLVPIPAATAVGEIIRDAISYRTNTGLVESVYFSNDSVYRLNSSNDFSDITPVGFPAGSSGITTKTGYGVGPYNREAYGTRRTAESAQIVPVARTSADMWGENTLFAFRNEGPLFEYTPDVTALEIATAPTDITDLVVTNQRIVMVIKNDGEIRQVIWSDREDNTEWTPTVSNYAGSTTLQGVGYLVSIHKILNQVLILSETDAYVGRYLGAPFVYGFEPVGNGCGPLTANAIVATDRFVMWWGARNFWMYDGTLKPIQSDVMDFLAADINTDAVSKMHTTVISDYNEVWWFYQSVGSTTDEVDSYVAFDYVEGHWSTGRLDRTCAFDKGAYPDPIMVNVAGALYNHEISSVQVEGTAYATTGPLELQEGNRNMAVRYVFPDTQFPNEVSLVFYTRDMPTNNDVTHGPFSYENPISTTGVLGREVRMEVTGLTNSWEVGTMRFDVQEVGGGFR